MIPHEVKYDGNQITSWDKCDWKPKRVQPLKIERLSAAIRAGHPMIVEDNTLFLSVYRKCGCALGAALIGVGMTLEQYEKEKYAAGDIGPAAFVFRKMAECFPAIPPAIFKEVSHRHFGGPPRLEIADWLESQGY